MYIYIFYTVHCTVYKGCSKMGVHFSRILKCSLTYSAMISARVYFTVCHCFIGHLPPPPLTPALCIREGDFLPYHSLPLASGQTVYGGGEGEGGWVGEMAQSYTWVPTFGGGHVVRSVHCTIFDIKKEKKYNNFLFIRIYVFYTLSHRTKSRFWSTALTFLELFKSCIQMSVYYAVLCTI